MNSISSLCRPYYCPRVQMSKSNGKAAKSWVLESILQIPVNKMNGKGSVYSVLEWFGALAHTCDLGTRITQKYNSRKSSETKAAVTQKLYMSDQ